jgi:hypothetical protein
MRRRVIISVLAFVAIASAVLAAFWFTRPHPRIDDVTLLKIERGMTEQQVIEIIGAPPGNYGFGEGDIDMWEELLRSTTQLRFVDQATPGGPNAFDTRPTIAKDWLGADQGIRATFADGKVVRAEMHRVWREYDSHFDRLLVLMRLKDRKVRPLLIID